MKNPLFIALFWFLCFLSETLFSWQWGGNSLAPWGSFFVLGYAFFELPFISAFCLASFAFVLQSSFSAGLLSPFFLIVALFLEVFWIRRKTFSGGFASRAFALFVLLTINFFLLEALLSNPLPDFRLQNLVFSGLHLAFNGVLGVFLFWVLQEKGELWEEKLSFLQSKKGQLNLFDTRHLRQVRRKPPLKIQKRFRQRFGFQNDG
ncbi:MAG: hypothetical protein U1F57_06720 [bacterium]